MSMPALPFGEYLVRRRMIDRFQLFEALQFQARHPGTLFGQCVVALGFVEMRQVELELAAHTAQNEGRRLARGTHELPAMPDAVTQRH